MDQRLDYLVQNAGTSLHKAFDQTTEEELDRLRWVKWGKGVGLASSELFPTLPRSPAYP
jgi:hypothetical protein